MINVLISKTLFTPKPYIILLIDKTSVYGYIYICEWLAFADDFWDIYFCSILEAFMVKKLFAIFLCLFSCGLLGCSAQKNNNGAGKVHVTVTFNALKEFVTAVGGNRVWVTTIIPDGSEPHDFEPRARDLVNIGNSRVFIYNGLKLESWVGQALNAVGSNTLIPVEASKGAQPITLSGSNRVTDPHLWLSLSGARTECENIKNALIQADPAGKNDYEKNYSVFTAKLQQLYSEFSSKFKFVKNKNLVAGHAAFAYMCRDFGLTQNSVEDVFASGEPSAQKLKQLIEFCKKNKVKTVFVEDMVSPAVSETLAREAGANVKKIYTVESSENGQSYYNRMKYNLNALYTGMV